MPIPPDPADPAAQPPSPVFPGVWVEESPAGPPALLNGPDALSAGFVGPTPAGPLEGPPPLLTSLHDYERVYGDGRPLVYAGQSVPNRMWWAARTFFAEGGQRLRVARVHRPDPTPGTTGGDGLLPTPADYAGAAGLPRLDALEDVAWLAAPDVAVADLPALHDLLLAHARRRPGVARERFALLDGAPDASVADLQALRRRLDGRCAALYHPWFETAGPDPVRLPPSPLVAGLMARIDRAQGPWATPVDRTRQAVGGRSPVLSLADQRQLIAIGINLLVDAAPGRRILGAGTLSSDPNWRDIGFCRGLAALQAAIERDLGWTAFEACDDALWARVRNSIEAPLHQAWRLGAFPGSTTDAAFFVRCDRTTMTQADIDAGRLIVRLGVAPLKPAEFVVLQLELRTAA